MYANSTLGTHFQEFAYDETKSLGVIVDEGLNWEERFKTVKGKVHGGLTSLKKLKNILPQSQLSNVYRALVESHMRYADVFLGHLSNSKKESLQRLQDRAISIIEMSRIRDEWSHNFLRTDPSTPTTTRDSAEIFRFRDIIWSMSKRIFLFNS